MLCQAIKKILEQPLKFVNSFVTRTVIDFLCVYYIMLLFCSWYRKSFK